MAILRACVTCGIPSEGSYCARHRPKPWSTSKRRERMGLSGGAWDTLRRKVLARDMGVCYLCDQFGADQVDHLVEVADDGTSHLTNLGSCHEGCHDRKHREPEWAQERVRRALAALGGNPFDPISFRTAEVGTAEHARFANPAKRAVPMTDECFYHGGPGGLRPGTRLLPTSETGARRLGDANPDRIYVTPDPWIAATFTIRHWPHGRVYEVEPEGELAVDPELGDDRMLMVSSAVVLREIALRLTADQIRELRAFRRGVEVRMSQGATESEAIERSRDRVRHPRLRDAIAHSMG